MSLLSLFRPQARYTRDWSGSVAVLAPGPLPTVDYYLTPRLRVLPAGTLRRFDSLVPDAAADQLPEGTFVVIVRHAEPAWLRLLARHRARWSGVAFLMDDDIPAAWSCAELPLAYRLWTSSRYWRSKGLLAAVCDRIWVSNARLQAAYPDVLSRVLPPMEPFGAGVPAPRGTRRWAYLGTHTHRREIDWLLPVVAAVQARSALYGFELFGDARIARQFSRVPRVRVREPRPWPEFVHYCSSAQLAVGVAPLLPGHFNAMRTHVKQFDITRCGAAGVFTLAEPYAPALDGVAGALLQNEPAAWIEAIVALLDDDDRRIACHARAAAWVAQAGHEVDLPALLRERVA
ncbi:MAG: hypothetical protein AB7O69_07185 [Burkholderiales bacterium]